VPAGAADTARGVGEQVARAHLLERPREELAQLPIGGCRPRPAARRVHQPLEEGVALDADRVDDDAGAAGRVEHGVFGQPARGVEAVGEDQEERPRPVVRAQRERQLQRIAQRRRAARLDRGQRAAHRGLVIRHRHAHVGAVREGDERHLVVGPERVDEPFAGLPQVTEPLARDAGAGVEEQRDAERQAIERHAVHVLRDAVVGEDEVARRESRHGHAAAHHGDVELNDLDAAAEHRRGWRRRLPRRRSGGERDRRRAGDGADHCERASPRSQATVA